MLITYLGGYAVVLATTAIRVSRVTVTPQLVYCTFDTHIVNIAGLQASK